MRTTLGQVLLYATTAESLELDIYCSSDPTGTAPAFALTDRGTLVTSGASYASGTWVGSYATNGWTTARTPTLGASGSLTIASGSSYWVWVKVVAGSETAVWLVGAVTAP